MIDFTFPTDPTVSIPFIVNTQIELNKSEQSKIFLDLYNNSNS